MQQIALERVDILFERALQIFHEDPDLANRYVDIARRVCMVARVRLTARWRPYICRGCKTLLVPSFNCQVRMQSRPGKGSRVVKTCLKCGHVTRYYVRNASSVTAEELVEDN
jgi:ribonuclease P protein subunit RPR2